MTEHRSRLHANTTYSAAPLVSHNQSAYGECDSQPETIDELENTCHGRAAQPPAVFRDHDIEPTYSRNATLHTRTNEHRETRQASTVHPLAAPNNQDGKPTDTENVIVIGKTGSGKSSIISLLLGRDIGIGHGIHSKTANANDYDFNLPAENGGLQIKLIDTQGVLDTKIDLATVLESLKDELTGRFNHVNTIMLVLECARFTRVAQEALNSLIQLFNIGNIEGSERLLLVVTKVEHLPIGKRAEIRRSIIEHSFFKTIGVSVKYLDENTIEVFAGQSEGVEPLLAPVYKKMREQSKARLLSALARNNTPMTISQDHNQFWNLIKKFTGYSREDPETTSVDLLKKVLDR